MSFGYFLAAALMAVTQPSVPERDLVPLIDCPYWPVYFRRDAIELEQQQRQQLDGLIDMIRQFEISDRALVVLGAYAPANGQRRWSPRRLDRVFAYLISHGVNSARIHVAAEPISENDLLGGPSEDPQVSYVVYRILVPAADRARLFPPGSPIC